MTLDTMPVQHGLDDLGKGNVRTCLPGVGSRLDRRPSCGQRDLLMMRWRLAAVLVASDARLLLARSQVDGRAHRLDSPPFGIQGLKIQFAQRGHPKVGGTIGFDRHHAQAPLAVVAAPPHHRRHLEGAGTGFVDWEFRRLFQNPQRLDLARLYRPPQPVMNVRQQESAFQLPRRLDSRRQYRRTSARYQRHRVNARQLRVFVDDRLEVCGVQQHDPEPLVGVWMQASAIRDQHPAVVQRERVSVSPFGQAGVVPDLRILAGDPVVSDARGRLGAMLPGDRPDRSQRPTVMRCEGGRHAFGAGNRSSLPDDRGIEHRVAEEQLQIRSVRIHCPKRLTPLHVPVDVLPTREQDLAVRQHVRRVVVQRVDGDLPDVAPVLPGAEQGGREGLRADVEAADASRAEDQSSVGQLFRAEIGVRTAGDLPSRRAIDTHRPDPPVLFALSTMREEQRSGIVGHVQIEDRALRVLPKDLRRQFRMRRIQPFNPASPVVDNPRPGMIADHAIGVAQPMLHDASDRWQSAQLVTQLFRAALHVRSMLRFVLQHDFPPRHGQGSVT